MCRHCHKPIGVSLVELLVALAVMGIVAVSLSALAVAVQMSSEYASGHGEAVQHARVAIERIKRTASDATATPDYPAFWVHSTTIDGYAFPDALIVWRPPSGTPSNSGGPPLFSELVIYTFDPGAPRRLLEITMPQDNRAAPLPTNSSQWTLELAAIHAGDTATRTQLTDLLRVGSAGSGDDDLRGVVRFLTRYHPTAAEWSDYQAGSLNWEEMTWPQNLYGAHLGVRHSWCHFELQLVPRGLTRRGAEAAEHAIVFFGSAVSYNTLAK